MVRRCSNVTVVVSLPSLRTQNCFDVSMGLIPTYAGLLVFSCISSVSEALLTNPTISHC